MGAEMISDGAVQLLTMVLSSLGELQQKLTLSFRQDFDGSPQVPDDHAVLLGGSLVVFEQSNQGTGFCGFWMVCGWAYFLHAHHNSFRAAS
jgi:hypothetical protein